MHPDLQRYLDGELTRASLPPELAAEADEWDSLLADAARLAQTRAPAQIEARVMAALAASAREPWWRRAAHALVEPRTVRVRPAVLAGAALAVLALVAWPWMQRARALRGGGAAPVVYVRFELQAPRARSVSLAGDFNQWRRGVTELQDPDGDGVWTAMVPLRAGMYQYMFVVDGRDWVSDPRAPRSVDDGFGMRNSLIAVEPPPRTS